MSTDSIKEVSYSSLMMPMASAVTTSVSAPSVFSTQADLEEKRSHHADHVNERTAASCKFA